MISILLLLVLAWGFYIGYRRGLVLQVYYFLVAVISAFVAGQFYKSLGDHFHLLVPYANPQEGQGTFFFPSDQLFHLDKVFYAGLAYLLVFGICYTIGRFIGLFLHLIPTKKLDVKWLRIGSGVLSLLVTLFVLQMALTILATVPLAVIQNSLEKKYSSQTHHPKCPFYDKSYQTTLGDKFNRIKRAGFFLALCLQIGRLGQNT